MDAEEFRDLVRAGLADPAGVSLEDAVRMIVYIGAGMWGITLEDDSEQS